MVGTFARRDAKIDRVRMPNWLELLKYLLFVDTMTTQIKFWEKNNSLNLKTLFFSNVSKRINKYSAESFPIIYNIKSTGQYKGQYYNRYNIKKIRCLPFTKDLNEQISSFKNQDLES